MTHKDKALAEMARVLKTGGRLLVLEFSKVARAARRRPTTGIRSRSCRGSASWVAGDAESYRYLAESIRVHPDQAELKAMMKSAGFGARRRPQPGRRRGRAARGDQVLKGRARRWRGGLSLGLGLPLLLGSDACRCGWRAWAAVPAA